MRPVNLRAMVFSPVTRRGISNKTSRTSPTDTSRLVAKQTPVVEISIALVLCLPSASSFTRLKDNKLRSLKRCEMRRSGVNTGFLLTIRSYEENTVTSHRVGECSQQHSERLNFVLLCAEPRPGPGAKCWQIDGISAG